MLSYLDPGTGSMIAAAFAGGIAGFGVLLRMYGHRVLGVFSKKHRTKLAFVSFGEELAFVVSFLEHDLCFFPVFIRRGYECVPLFGEHFRGNVRARIQRYRVTKKWWHMLHGIKERIPQRGLTVIAAKRAIRIHQESAFIIARVVLSFSFCDAFDEVARRRGEPEFRADKVFEDGAIIPTNRAMRFVAADSSSAYSFPPGVRSTMAYRLGRVSR